MSKHEEKSQECLEKLKQWQDYAKYSSPYKRGDVYFYWKNTGLQNQVKFVLIFFGIYSR